MLCNDRHDCEAVRLYLHCSVHVFYFTYVKAKSLWFGDTVQDRSLPSLLPDTTGLAVHPQASGQVRVSNLTSVRGPEGRAAACRQVVVRHGKGVWGRTWLAAVSAGCGPPRVHPQEGLIWAQGEERADSRDSQRSQPRSQASPSWRGWEGARSRLQDSRPTTWYSLCVCV